MLALMALVQCAPAWAGKIIRICGDERFPPFGFVADDNTMHGATLGLLSQVFGNIGVRYQVALMPWVRCLAYVKDGTYQIGIDSYFDEARSHVVDYSRPYYALTPYYYFSRKRYPAGLNIKRIEDLKKYRACGMRGFTYEHYQLSPADIDTGSTDYATLKMKVKFGLCDYFPAEREVMKGDALLDQKHVADADMGCEPSQIASRPQLHFILTRNDKDMAKLLPLLNQQIELSDRQGTMQELVDQTLSALRPG
jgi:polar amino acid transport system substrate-binding protein